jgi:hypothetical protein
MKQQVLILVIFYKTDNTCYGSLSNLHCADVNDSIRRDDVQRKRSTTIAQALMLFFITKGGNSFFDFST